MDTKPTPRTLELARAPISDLPRKALFVLRGFLILLALGMPLHVPFALPQVGQSKILGWNVAPLSDRADAVLVTQTGWGPQLADLRAGDILVEIEGEPASPGRTNAIREQARPGDVLSMVVLHDGEARRLTITVEEGSWAYAAYQWYRVALALGAWLVACALLVWRGNRLDNVILAGALLLLGPVLLVIDLPIQGGILPNAMNYLWKIQAAAYRLFFPALLLCFVAIRTRQPRFLISPFLWGAVLSGLFLALGLMTEWFTDPLAWSNQGFERDVRTWFGLVVEVLALTGVFLAQRHFSIFPSVIRWLAFGILVLLGLGVPLSIVILAAPDNVWLIEFLRQLKSLVLALLVVTAALHFLTSGNDGSDSWNQRRHMARYGSALLMALYGFAVAGTGLIVHGSMDSRGDQGEWLIFLTVFAAVILFSPVFRWTQDFVERKVYSRWIQLEAEAKVVVDLVCSELQPGRIAMHVRQRLPPLLDLADATLVISAELANRWDKEDIAGIDIVLAEELGQPLENRSGESGSVVIPVEDHDGRAIAELRLGLTEWRPHLEEPEVSMLRSIAKGVASALRSADTHFELQETQRELAEADRIAALGSLAGGLAHEVKNPLASLKMGLHLLKREGGQTDRFARIERDVLRIDDLVSSLLRFTHSADDTPPERVDLVIVAQGCVEDLRPSADDRDVKIEERYEAEKGALTMGGEREVRIIVSNLLSNALDAVGMGGKIEISVAAGETWLELAVFDNGHGIQEGQQSRMFDLGFSTKPGGTGLGLALARWETEHLGGTIAVERREPCGTALLVRLPTATIAPEAEQAEIAASVLQPHYDPARRT